MAIWRRCIIDLPRTRIALQASRFIQKQARVYEPSFLQENLAQPIASAVDTGRRVLRVSLFGLLACCVTAGTLFEFQHMWVENVSLAPERNETKWQWELEDWKWQSDRMKGGTDAELGLKARHLVRMAWMAENWSTGDLSVQDERSGEGNNVAVVNPTLKSAKDRLHAALILAEYRAKKGLLRPEVLSVLLIRYALVLERLGPEYLIDSRRNFELAWRVGALGGQTTEAALALHLGNINSRLNDVDSAVRWWKTAIQVMGCETSNVPVDSTSPHIPDQMPQEPFLQRLMASTFTSISSFYAASGNLLVAHAIQEASLNLIRNIPSSFLPNNSSLPETLHHLTLLQRSSVLSLHLAEVSYALDKQKRSEMGWWKRNIPHTKHDIVGECLRRLSSAAESSEIVIQNLTDTPDPISDSPKPTLADSVAAIYANSVNLRNPACRLLRDARRTGATSYNLMGTLIELAAPNQPASQQAAFQYYHRAYLLIIPSITAETSSEGIPAAEWDAIRNNYLRLKNILEASAP